MAVRRGGGNVQGKERMSKKDDLQTHTGHHSCQGRAVADGQAWEAAMPGPV